jgi:hypothetical protein
MIKLLLALLLSACGSSTTRHVNANDAIALRSRLRTQAFTCDGLPAQDTTYKGRQHCGIGDSELYAGMGCLAGEKRFCVAPNIELLDSKDMWLGAIAYAIVTKDAEFISKARAYLRSKPGSVCFDACTRTPIIQDMFARVGFSDGGRLPAAAINSTLLTASLTAPEGYQLRLIADEIVIYRKLGVSISSKIAGNLYRRQSCNSYFRFLAYGSFDLQKLNKPAGTGKTWLFSDACSEMDVKRSNGNMELYLINLVINGI